MFYTDKKNCNFLEQPYLHTDIMKLRIFKPTNKNKVKERKKHLNLLLLFFFPQYLLTDYHCVSSAFDWYVGIYMFS